MSADASELLSYAYAFSSSGQFKDKAGEIDDIGQAAVTQEQAAILFSIVQDLRPSLTIETGFGGGLSAMTFMAAKSTFGLGQHISIDPWGLGEGRGRKVGAYLEETLSNNFMRIKEKSEFALPRLAQSYKDQVLVSFVDGGHLFEQALIDFTYFDFMCPIGGCIIVDDTNAPAIASVVNFIAANRANFEIERPTENMVIMWKRGPDERSWNHFAPFDVVQKHGWA